MAPLTLSERWIIVSSYLKFDFECNGLLLNNTTANYPRHKLQLKILFINILFINI